MTNGEAAAHSRDRQAAGNAVAVPPDAAVVRAALARILQSAEFANAPRLQRFLSYVVDATLEGRAATLRAYAIAVDVFDRPADFDPQADSLVRVEAGRLRQKLDAYYANAGHEDQWRISLPKGGYAPRFTRQAEAPQPASPVAAAPRRRLAIVVASAAVLLVIGVAAAVLLQRPSPLVEAVETEIETVRQPAPALAVLPFEALAGEPPSLGPTITVADGLTTLITAELVSFRQFFVLARRSATALASGDADAIAAARAAALDYVVDGTVRREGDAFVVTASLVDTTSGQAVWSETFRESATGSEVLELESRIAGAIVTALAQPYGILNRQLARAAHRADLPEKLSSYACILEADHYYATYAMADFRSALACLEATLAAEPDYAHAWAYLAYLRLDALRYGYGLETAEGTIEAALAAASRALDLEPENAMAQRAMAAVLFTEGDLEGFRRHAELALELNPNDSDALADLGGKIAYSGDWERGLALRRQAIERNPAHPPAYRIPFAFDAFRRGDDTVALAELDRIGLSNFLITSLLRAAVLGRHGPPAAAGAAVAELLALQPDAASYARDYFRYWNLSPELVDDLLDGLSRAGLDVST